MDTIQKLDSAPATAAAEPSGLEVLVTVAVGVLFQGVYRGCVERLELWGDERVLDFGSGAGTPGKLIAERLSRGGQLTCLDVSRRWLDVARRRLGRFGNVDYRLGEIGVLAMPDASYDAVFVHFVLHEIPTPARGEVVGHLARVLAPGGRLLVREPIRFIEQGEIRDLMDRRQLVEVSARVEKVPTQGLAFEGIYEKRASWLREQDGR